MIYENEQEQKLLMWLTDAALKMHGNAALNNVAYVHQRMRPLEVKKDANAKPAAEHKPKAK